MTLAELITRCLLGIATADEQQRLQAWLDASPEHRAEYERMLSRLRADLLAEERLAFRRMSKYVAAAVVVLAFLSAALWYALPRMDDERVAAIVPGSPKAMLQVEGGEEVEIFPDMTDVETHASAWTMRNEGGILRYDMPTRADSIRSQWHTLSVPRGGEYTVLLADGTKICVNSESRLRYPVVFAPADTVRRVFVSGEAYFQVARHESLPFEVCTEHGTVRVYGTKFNVHDYADEGRTVVTLLEGKVGYTVGGHEYRLSPGSQLTLDHASGRVEEKAVDALAYCSWIDGVFEFNSMPLERIMKQLSRWYDVDYRFENQELKRRLFTGITFRRAPLRNLLDQIEKTTRIHFKIENRTIIITN